MDKHPVKIDLSTFFDDERRMVLILVDPSWESVESLQKRVQKVFDVDKVRFLTNDGYFIPPQEPIAIIKSLDTVKAFIPSESLRKMKQKKSKQQKVSDEANNSVENEPANMLDFAAASRKPMKKRKHLSLENGFMSSTPNNNNKKYKDAKSNCYATISEEFQRSNKSCEITSTNDNLGSSLQAHKPTTVVQNNEATLKVNSHKKPKNSSVNCSNHTIIELNASQKSCKKSAANQARPTNSKVNNSIPCNSHIYFDNDENNKAVNNNTIGNDSTLERTLPAKPKIIFKSLLCEVTMTKPRIFKIKDESMPKRAIEIQEHIIIPNVTHSHLESAAKTQNEKSLQKDISLNCSKKAADASLNEYKDDSLAMSYQNDNESKLMSAEATLEPADISVSASLEKSSEDILELKRAAILKGGCTTNENKPEDMTLEVTVDPADISESASFEKSNIVDKENSFAEISAAANSLVQAEARTLNHTKYDISKNGSINDSSIMLVDDDEEDEDEDEDCTQNDESEIIELNETNAIALSDNKTLPNTQHNAELTVEKLLPFSVDLTSLPELEDIVLFKAYTNRRNITEYFAGKVTYINKRSKLLSIQVLDNEDQVGLLPTINRANLDESTALSIISIKLSDMIEPKLLSVS